MHKLELHGLPDLQMLAIADALLARGSVGLAAQVYGIGARATADPAMRTRFSIRSGLPTNPNASTLPLLEILQLVEKIDNRAFIGDGIATWMKHHSFMEDERFTAIAAKHADQLPFANWHWALQTILWATQAVRNVPGDFVELGVFKGHTTAVAAEYLGFADWPKTWWLYDTFDGIPDDQVDPGWEEINRNLYKGTFSAEEVRARLSGYPNIKVVQGRVPEVLSSGAPDQISFIHLDLNNAAAEIAGLETLIDRLSPGGIIVLDDYGWASARAQHNAEAAWFSARGYHVLPLPTGQGVFVKPA